MFPYASRDISNHNFPYLEDLIASLISKEFVCVCIIFAYVIFFSISLKWKVFMKSVQSMKVLSRDPFQYMLSARMESITKSSQAW